jgi:hypothetical protein
MTTANEVASNANKMVIYRCPRYFDGDQAMKLIRYIMDFETGRKTLVLRDGSGAEYYARMEDVYELAEDTKQVWKP